MNKTGLVFIYWSYYFYKVLQNLQIQFGHLQNPIINLGLKYVSLN